MSTIKIYGSSDDNVIIDGDVDGCDEYGHSSSGWGYIVVSDGSTFRIAFCPGDLKWWAVQRVSGKTLTCDIEPPSEDFDEYTEVATITGDFTWVRWIGPDEDIAKRFARLAGTRPRKLEKVEDVVQKLCERVGFDDFWRDIEPEERADILCDLMEMFP